MPGGRGRQHARRGGTVGWERNKRRCAGCKILWVVVWWFCGDLRRSLVPVLGAYGCELVLWVAYWWRGDNEEMHFPDLLFPTTRRGSKPLAVPTLKKKTRLDQNIFGPTLGLGGGRAGHPAFRKESRSGCHVSEFEIDVTGPSVEGGRWSRGTGTFHQAFLFPAKPPLGSTTTGTTIPLPRHRCYPYHAKTRAQ